MKSKNVEKYENVVVRNDKEVGINNYGLEYMVAIEQENYRLNSIINTILNFDFFKDECPLNFCYTEKCDEEEAQNVFYEDDYCEENCDDNNYKKCWLKYFKKLQELKGSDKE